MTWDTPPLWHMAKPHLQCPVEKEAARELEEELEEAGETGIPCTARTCRGSSL